jgi:hypothetical protein
MTNIDRAIRDALSKEDADFLANFEDKNPIDEALSAFSGRWGAMNIFAAMIAFVLFGVFVYCAWQAFSVEALRDVVLWSAGAMVTALAVAMLKMYFFMELNKNVVLREVKRLELQVARLAAREPV